jgi:hypothetical protein
MAATTDILYPQHGFRDVNSSKAAAEPITAQSVLESHGTPTI